MSKIDQKVDGNITTEKAIADAVGSINKVLVRDPDGVILVTTPIGRNPESGKMEFAKIPHKEVDVPPDQVVYFTGSSLMDMRASQSLTVEINDIRTVVIFDRNYVHGKKRYNQVAWLPNKAVRAGVLFEKKINPQNRQPMAVLRKLPDGKTPMFQIIGAKEPEYRALRKIFEQIWFKRIGGKEQDDELSRFMYDSIEPISDEIAK